MPTYLQNPTINDVGIAPGQTIGLSVGTVLRVSPARHVYLMSGPAAAAALNKTGFGIGTRGASGGLLPISSVLVNGQRQETNFVLTHPGTYQIQVLPDDAVATRSGSYTIVVT